MSVSYASTLKSTRMQSVIAAIDAGASTGYLEICIASYAAVLSTIPFTKPSFTESGGVITAASLPRTDNNAAGSGTAAVGRVKDSNGNVVIQGLTVGVGSGDIQLGSVNITAGQAVSLTAATFTHSP